MPTGEEVEVALARGAAPPGDQGRDAVQVEGARRVLSVSTGGAIICLAQARRLLQNGLLGCMQRRRAPPPARFTVTPCRDRPGGVSHRRTVKADTAHADQD